MQYHEAGVHQGDIRRRHGTDIIDSLILCRVGIQVPAKGNAMTFQGLDYSFPGKIVRTLKSHVFQKVGKSVLVIVLQNRTDILNDVKACPVLRFLIMPHIICQAVGQFACQNLVRNRNFLVVSAAAGDHQSHKQDRK